MEETTMGKRIAAHRKRLGLTQDQLAEQMGVSPQAVSKWENDLSCPDISALPRLTEIFGVTTDELLGVAPKEPVFQGEVVTEKTPVKMPPKRWPDGIFFALWVIALGGMLLAGRLLEQPVGLWTAAWTTALFVFGLGSLIREFHFFGLAAAWVGAYFMGYKLDLIPEVRSWDIVWPVVIVILGLCLLADSLWGRHRRKNCQVPLKNCRECGDSTFTFRNSFGEDTFLVNTPVLRGGDVSVSFGEHTLSLTGVGKVAQSCTISASNSFGELRILVPRRFRVELDGKKAFANLEMQGQPVEKPEGTIYLQVSTNFGETVVTYV